MAAWRGSLVAALVLFHANVALADDADEGTSLGKFRSGSWTAKATFHGTDYTDGPRYFCVISNGPSRYIQSRPPESGSMESSWEFAVYQDQDLPNTRIDRVEIGGRKYQVVRLPWRLSRPKPPEPGSIVLSFDRTLFAFRSAADDAWLPFEYLTPQFIEAGRFGLTYSYENEDETRSSKRLSIDMAGFREAAKWCGSKLLSDRIEEEKVKRLIK